MRTGTREFQNSEILTAGEMVEAHGLMPWSSNYTFLVTISVGDQETLAVYKPSRGERPLWDFPRGTLALRELAAYHVCRALDWNFIPLTVLRDGLYGPGAVQLFVEADFDLHYFDLRDRHIPLFQRVAAFDLIVNNADRKAGHCLQDEMEQIWLVDHGLTFHVEDKLRTVIWDFAGQPIPATDLRDLARLQKDLDRSSGSLSGQLQQLISPEEMDALRRRLKRLIAAGHFPMPGPGRCIPYPPV